MPGDLPLSGGLVSPLFSNMALRFLTWLIFGVVALIKGKAKKIMGKLIDQCWENDRWLLSRCNNGQDARQS